MEKSQNESEESGHKDLQNWKLGFFYFNKKDNRIFVDKPNPNYGTTLNFAHPKAYLILMLAFVFFGFIFYMITKNQ